MMALQLPSPIPIQLKSIGLPEFRRVLWFELMPLILVQFGLGFVAMRYFLPAQFSSYLSHRLFWLSGKPGSATTASPVQKYYQTRNEEESDNTTDNTPNQSA